jgi:uncharacterized protein
MSSVENNRKENPKNKLANSWKKTFTISLLVFGLMLVVHFIYSFYRVETFAQDIQSLWDIIDRDFILLVCAGFLAQLVDGALGMGYGIVSATSLMTLGVNFTAASASIHTAEMFASGASGYSHYKIGNVDKQLFKRLVIPGVIGSVAGALVLSKFGETYAAWVKPCLAVYIAVLGVKYIIMALRNKQRTRPIKHIGRLAGIGGFLDSFGGGGWGPLVTTSLLRSEAQAKTIIGSVSLTEFFVTLASAFTFFTIIGISHWNVILALIVGGLIAAPISARLAGKLNKRSSFLIIGLLASLWSIRVLYSTFIT